MKSHFFKWNENFLLRSFKINNPHFLFLKNSRNLIVKIIQTENPLDFKSKKPTFNFDCVNNFSQILKNHKNIKEQSNKFYLSIYKQFGNYYNRIFSEKIWLENYRKKVNFFDSLFLPSYYSDNKNSRKSKLQVKICSFQRLVFPSNLYLMIDTYLTYYFKFVYFNLMFYFKTNCYFFQNLFTQSFLTLNFIYFSFLKSQFFSRVEKKIEESAHNLFLIKQYLKASFLKFSFLIVYETKISFTNFFFQKYKSNYDLIEHLYLIFQSQTKFVFKSTILFEVLKKTKISMQISNLFLVNLTKTVNLFKYQMWPFFSQFFKKAEFTSTFLFNPKKSENNNFFFKTCFFQIFEKCHFHKFYYKYFNMPSFSYNLEKKQVLFAFTIPKKKRNKNMNIFQNPFLKKNGLLKRTKSNKKIQQISCYRIPMKFLKINQIKLVNLYKDQICFMIFNQTFLFLSSQKTLIFDFFFELKNLTKNFMPVFSIKFSQTFFCHSCFSLYNQKVGFDIDDFYLTHKIHKLKRVSLNFLRTKFLIYNSPNSVSIYLKSKVQIFWSKFYYFSCFLIENNIKQRTLIDTLLIFFCSFKFKILQQQNFQKYRPNQIKKISLLYWSSYLNPKIEALDYLSFLSVFYKASPFLFSKFFLSKVQIFETEEIRKRYLGISMEIEILPSPLSLLKHLKSLKKTINLEKVKTQKDLIHKLKKQINQWCYSHRIISNRKNLFFCDFLLSKWIWKWACRRHSKKSHNWIRQKYYHIVPNKSFENSPHSLFSNFDNKKNYRFCIFDTFKKTFFCLSKHSDLILKRNNKIKTHYSIFGENWKYWFNKDFLIN